MCFSETASFTAAAVLTAQGLASLHLVRKHKSLLLLACIPLFFALQQFSEGVIWHYFNHNLPIQGLALLGAQIFLFIAFLGWPILIPLAVWIPETNRWRKLLLSLFILGGVAWGVYLIYSLLDVNLKVTNHEHSLLYGVDFYTDQSMNVLKWIYLGLIILPIFISSLTSIWVFGLATLVSAGIAQYFYETTFTSVWCFFGALLSLLLYKILKINLSQSVN